MMIINKKERVIAAINHKEVDKIPTTYRGTKYISEALMKYFKIEEFRLLGGQSNKDNFFILAQK